MTASCTMRLSRPGRGREHQRSLRPKWQYSCMVHGHLQAGSMQCSPRRLRRPRVPMEHRGIRMRVEAFGVAARAGALRPEVENVPAAGKDLSVGRGVDRMHST